MVITASREERRLASVTLREFEAQHVTIEPERSIQVGHLQMDMADPRPRIHRLKRHTHYATLPT